MEGHSVRTSGAGLRSSASAKEAWDVYVNTHLAPVLASALAINGKELPGTSDIAALLNLSMEQAQFPQTADNASPDRTSNARETAQVLGCLTPACILEEASTEQPSSATYDEALWAALAAAACRRCATQRQQAAVPGAPAEAQESSQDGSPADRHGVSGQRECSPSISGESSDAVASDGWAGTFACSHTEPSSFNGTFRAQRTRRTVRVVRTAARSRPPKEASPAAGAAVPLTSDSAPAPPMCRGSPRRTRKKRAAASLVEGIAFHAPASAPPPGRDAGDSGAGRQRTSGSFSPCSPTHSAAVISAAFPVLEPPPLHASSGCMPPPCSHRVQIGSPSSGSPVSDSSTASKQQGSPRRGATSTASLPEPGQQQQLDAAPSADMAGPSCCWGRPPILLAAATGRADIVRHLLASAPKDPSTVRLEDFRLMQENLEEAAQQAAALGTPPFERSAGSRPPGPLLALPSDLLTLDPLGLLHCTALHLAALHGHAQVAQVLLASPTCSIRSRNAEGATALHIAAREGWTQVVSLLARAPGCELDACDYGGRTALHLAALRAHTDAVNELWCRGCKMDPVDANGCTALHYAAEAGHTQVVANLVIAGCLVHMGTSAGWTAAHLAASNGHAEVLQKLLVGGYEVDCISGTGGWTALHLAAHNGHVKAVNVLLMAGANVELKCNTGADVLHCAAESGCLEVFERILAVRADHHVGKCDVSGTDLVGAQVVHRAAMGGNGAIFQRLLDLGSDEAALTSSGRTTLHYAALGGHLEMLDWLLKRGAAVNHEDSTGVTPVMVAAEGGSAQLLSILLEHGANLHACSAAGCNALHFASCSGSEEVLDLLLEKGSDLEVVCQRGATVVHHAAEADRPDVLARLLQRAGESLVRVQDSLGWTALHYAAMHEHCDCAALLIQAGAELDVRSTEGLTPLHLAARAQSTSVANLLLASGADGSIRDASSRTALHYAAQTGNWSLFHTLHEHAACRVLEPDDRGLSPLHYAVEGGSLDIVGVLLAYLRASSDGQTASPQSPVCADTHEPSRGRGQAAEAGTKGQHHHSPACNNSSLQQHASQAGADVRLRCRGGSKAGLSLAPSEQPGTAAGKPPVSDGPCQPSHEQTPPPTSSAASFTPLHMAAYKGHAELIPYLLQAGYAAATFDALHRTPLHYAALQGCQAFELPAGSVQQADTLAATSGPASEAAGENDRTQEAVGAARKAAQPIAITGPSRLPWKALAPHSSSGSTGCTPHLQRHAGSCLQHPSGRAIPTEAAAGSAPLLPLTAGVTMPHVAAPGRQARGLDARPAAVQWTGLMPHARVDFPGASELLMAAGADVYAVDTYGRTALHYAAGTGDQVLVERLLEVGVPMGAADAAGWTPLSWAAGSGHADCVSRLLEAGAGVGAKDSQGRLPLHWAAERGWAQVVALLVPAMLQGGLDLHAPDKAGASAVALAAIGAHVECVAHILDSTATATERGLTALHLAVQDGLDLLVTQLLLLPGATPDSRDKDGLTPLHWAASRGFDGIVEQLLVAGADIDAVTNDGWTALHEASLNGHTAVVLRLLQSGAQVGLKTSMGLTALHNAATNGHCEIAEALLAAGASPNARALSNATALFCAAGAGHAAIVRRLLAVGAEIGVAAGAGATALHAAAGAGHLAVVEDLLGAHADVDVQAQNGATALHNAAGGGYDKIVKALLAAKADTDIQNSNCNTALHLAAGKGHVEVVETLLAAGASAHIRNAKGWAAVHSAAAAGQLEVVLRLVAAGAAPRSRPDLDVLRLLTRKTTYRHSYVEGRLRLAEKERQRIKSKSAAGGAQAGPSQEELAALEAQANANMAALLEEEEVKKDVEEKKKNKKKDRKKRKGKKGDDKEVEEEAEGPADDLKHDEASDDASPPGAEESAAEGSGVQATEQSGMSSPPSTAKQVKPSLAQPGKNGKQAKGGAQAVEEDSTSVAPSHPMAAKGAPQKGPPKCPAKQDRARKNAPRQADAHAAGTASDKAAEEDADASEWQSVGAAQRKARRGHKAPNPQPAGAPHQVAVPTTTHHKAPQQPPPPPLRGAPTAVGGTKVAGAAPARPLVPAASQEPRPSRHQARAVETRAVAPLPAAQAQGNIPAPSFADVARPVQDRPAKATKRDAAASSSPVEAARAGSPMTQGAGCADKPLHVGAAATQLTSGALKPIDMRRAVADTVASASQQPASVTTPQQQLPVPPKTASTVPPGTPTTCQPLPALAPLPAVPQPPPASGSSLSALAKTWHPIATSAALMGPLGATAEQRGQSRETAAASQGDEHGVGVRREGSASAAPINAAPAVWRSSLGTHSVDWSFPRTSSGTSLSSLVPPRPPANGGSGVDAASDRVTCSSLESSASLCLTEGLLGAEPLLADGSPVKSSGPHGSSATSRLQISSSPLGRMSMGSGGIHSSAAAAAAGAAPATTRDYAAVLSDIWNSPQREVQPGHPTPCEQPDPAGLSSPDATANSGSSLEVRRMAEAYQLTCPITKELMRDPVVASDGYTYERAAIEAWMADSMVSPRTGQPLKHKDLVPNLTLRASISILIPRSCLSTHF